MEEQQDQYAGVSAEGPTPTAPPDAAGPPLPPPTAPPPRRRSPWGWIIGILVLLVFLGGGFMLMMAFSVRMAFRGEEDITYGERVGIIYLSGVIMDSGHAGSLFGAPGGSRPVMEHLRRAAKDKNIKAVVLRINSPGGAVAASQELYTEVHRLAEKKPVTVSMGDVAASGGYYVASAADHIIANPGSTTGSIGVIAEFMRFNRLGEKIGIDVEAITSGPFKDAGSPWRDLRPQERELFESLIMDIYDQFVKDVAQGRDMDEKTVRELADGRVYTGAQAKELGLVDELGNLYDAISYAGKQCDLGPDPPTKEYGRGRGLWSLLAEAAAQAHAQALRRLLGDAQLGGLLLSPGPQPRTQSPLGEWTR